MDSMPAAIHAQQDATHRDEGDAIQILVDVNQAAEYPANLQAVDVIATTE